MCTSVPQMVVMVIRGLILGHQPVGVVDGLDVLKEITRKKW
jgi:hypothetical protein